MIELDKSHVWSLGVLHYFLLAGTWPTLNLVGSHASVNLKELNADAETICQLEKCMALTVEFRCDLETMSVDNVDGESLLQFLSQEQHESLADAHSEAMNEEKSELQ